MADFTDIVPCALPSKSSGTWTYTQVSECVRKTRGVSRVRVTGGTSRVELWECRRHGRQASEWGRRDVLRHRTCSVPNRPRERPGERLRGVHRHRYRHLPQSHRFEEGNGDANTSVVPGAEYSSDRMRSTTEGPDTPKRRKETWEGPSLLRQDTDTDDWRTS